MDSSRAQELDRAITDAVQKSKASSRFHGVALDDADLEDDVVYRVGLRMDALSDLSDDELADIVQLIEDAVEDIDPRVPSIRFLEAV